MAWYYLVLLIIVYIVMIVVTTVLLTKWSKNKNPEWIFVGLVWPLDLVIFLFLVFLRTIEIIVGKFTDKEEKPSLPDNLDEAAEEYAWQKEEPLAEGERLSTCFNPRIEAFKAGGKWMAEQGYTTETIIDRTPMNGPIGICLHLHDSTGFKIDDKVIVQIRKK